MFILFHFNKNSTYLIFFINPLPSHLLLLSISSYKTSSNNYNFLLTGNQTNKPLKIHSLLVYLILLTVVYIPHIAPCNIIIGIFFLYHIFFLNVHSLDTSTAFQRIETCDMICISVTMVTNYCVETPRQQELLMQSWNTLGSGLLETILANITW